MRVLTKGKYLHSNLLGHIFENSKVSRMLKIDSRNTMTLQANILRKKRLILMRQGLRMKNSYKDQLKNSKRKRLAQNMRHLNMKKFLERK